MSTERETLLANCLADPADDTARSVYADWLRDQDSPLGRFLWAGVTLAKFRGNDPVEDGMFFDAQRDLNATAPDVLAAQLKALLGWTEGEFAWDQDDKIPDRITAVQIPQPIASTAAERRRRRKSPVVNPAAVYERGMLCGLRLPLSRWRAVGMKVLDACPLERVEVLDVPGLTLRVMGPEDGWRLEGELKLPARPARAAQVLTASWPGGSPRLRELIPLDRGELVGAIDRATDWLAAELRTSSDDRWPGPQEVDVDDGGEQ